MTERSLVDYEIRSYADEDEAAVLRLLTSSLGEGPGGERSADFWRWKHLANPFGRSFMLVASSGDRIIGLRAFMRWQLRSGDDTLHCVRAVDTATHPDFQGRGIFSKLTRTALDSLREDTDLVFNTPNEKSGPGYLKLGWHPVGRFPIAVRVRRPVRFARSARELRSTTKSPDRPPPDVEAPTAAEILETGALDALLAGAKTDARLTTPKSRGYLGWRYGRAPLLDYRGICHEEGGEIRGVAFFRLRARGRLWEAAVTDVIVPPGDTRTASQLLRSVARAAAVDHMTCYFPPRTVQARAATRRGFLPSPQGMHFVVNVLREELRPTVSGRESWALSFGDLEVF